MINSSVAPTVLIVDDTEFNRKKLTAALSAIDVTAVVAENGQAGLDLMRKRPFDLVLLAIIMPGRDLSQPARPTIAS
mgnify:CR=1 FL=1